MSSRPPRLFADDAAVRRVGEGLLDHTLPLGEWTHEAHLAAALWLLRCRPDIDVDAGIRAIISGYNVAQGGVNDDAAGYHDTITRTCLAGVRAFLARRPAGEPLVEAVNALLVSPEGARDWPLRFYTRETLASAAARRAHVPPDRAPLPSA